MILSLYGKGEGDKGGGRREGLGKGGGRNCCVQYIYYICICTQATLTSNRGHRASAPRGGRGGGRGRGEGHPEQRYATGSVARILAPTAERSSCSSER